MTCNHVATSLPVATAQAPTKGPASASPAYPPSSPGPVAHRAPPPVSGGTKDKIRHCRGVEDRRNRVEKNPRPRGGWKRGAKPRRRAARRRRGGRGLAAAAAAGLGGTRNAATQPRIHHTQITDRTLRKLATPDGLAAGNPSECLEPAKNPRTRSSGSSDEDYLDFPPDLVARPPSRANLWATRGWGSGSGRRRPR